VALGNASITWVLLIIAPLGLFTVITCTALVLIASLERLGLLNANDWTSP
jgi:hypothetical protein